MNRKLRYDHCRELGAGPPKAAHGVQLHLFPTPRLALDSACYRCGRAARFWIRVDARVVGVCDWHETSRLPLGVRLGSFAHIKR
jgi:hypothetical protein